MAPAGRQQVRARATGAVLGLAPALSVIQGIALEVSRLRRVQNDRLRFR
jgi:hypothetical protein